MTHPAVSLLENFIQIGDKEGKKRELDEHIALFLT